MRISSAWHRHYICCAIDLNAIIIGRGVTKEVVILIEAYRNSLYGIYILCSQENCLNAAELGNDVGIYGTTKMVLI